MDTTELAEQFGHEGDEQSADDHTKQGRGAAQPRDQKKIDDFLDAKPLQVGDPAIVRKQAAGNAPQYSAEDEDACPQPTGIYSQTDGRILRVPHGAERKATAATNEIVREQHANSDDAQHQIVEAQGRIQYEAEDLQLWNTAD